MDEFWVCQHCRSLNRAGSGRCYHCREKFGTRPKEPAGAIVKGAAAPNISQFPGGPGGPPAPGLPPAGPVAPLGTGSFSPIGGSRVGDPPAYLSRPAVPAPSPIRDFSALAPPVAPASRFPSPTGWFRRRVSWALAARPFVSVWLLGYLSAGLLTLVLLDGALIVTTVTPLGRTALQSGSLTLAWSQVDHGHQWMLEAMAVAFAAFAILGLLFHSIFLGLSTHNAAGLGADPPYLSPYRAGMCWWSLVWAQLKIAIGLIVPAVLIWKGYALPGLIVALIAVELGQRRLDDPVGWLTGPSRHISHLFAGLGVSGSSNTLLGRAWSACFVVSNALFMLVCALPLIGLLAVAAAGLADRMDLVTWPTSGLGPIQLALAALAALLVLTTSAAIGLLVPVSIEMVERQRTRLGLLRAGRARPWIARPGYGSAPARDYGPTRYDPDGREAEGPSQASLNSPSTTSSFPWEEEDVSEESPPD